MSSIPFLILGILVLLAHVFLLREMVMGALRGRFLRDQEPAPDSQCPSVTLIAPARNEERNIERAARSLLAMDYPKLEILIVEDRSTDRTGEILERLSAENPRLRVVRVKELPAGWLGKNHALHQGGMNAGSDLVLFTDADVVFDPLALRRAVQYFREQNLDHLAIGPDVETPTLPVRIAVEGFGFFFLLHCRPWRVGDPDSAAHIGIGAFNLLRREAFVKLGGMERIRLRPDDDIKLGKIVKESGLRQGALHGGGCISVEWYPTLRDMVHGLEKNVFAHGGYNVLKSLLGILVLLLLFHGPIILPWLTEGPARWMLLGALVCEFTAAGLFSLATRNPLRFLASFPLVPLFMAFVSFNSMAKCLWRGGIEWRGTRYSLAELKKNRV